MNPSVRRKLSDGKPGHSRVKGSKSEEHEGKPGPSGVSLPSSPSREEEPCPENSTESPGRAGWSNGTDTDSYSRKAVLRKCPKLKL